MAICISASCFDGSIVHDCSEYFRECRHDECKTTSQICEFCKDPIANYRESGARQSGVGNRTKTRLHPDGRDLYFRFARFPNAIDLVHLHIILRLLRILRTVRT